MSFIALFPKVSRKSAVTGVEQFAVQNFTSVGILVF
jgi:hypothetical protein